MNRDAAHIEATTTAPNTTPRAISTQLLPSAPLPRREGAHAGKPVHRTKATVRRRGEPVGAEGVFGEIRRGNRHRENLSKKGESGMAATEGTRAVKGPDYHSEIDWEAAERSPEFRELIRKKRSFVVPATVFFLAWYFGFVILAGYAPDFMGREFLTDGLTVGYVLALSQFVMTWGLGAWYLRKADRTFDPLAERAAQVALRRRDNGGTS